MRRAEENITSGQKLHRAELYHYDQKENIPLKINYEPQRDRKFAYATSLPKKSVSASQQRNNQATSLQQQNNLLKQQLSKEVKNKQYFKQLLIDMQQQYLEQLQGVELKFKTKTQQNEELKNEVALLKNRERRIAEQESCSQKYQKLEMEHKKVKNVANSMIDMMKKVQGSDGDLHQAWKWVKKTIWEYQAIRKKALQWKAVYDQVTEAVQIIKPQQKCLHERAHE